MREHTKSYVTERTHILDTVLRSIFAVKTYVTERTRKLDTV